MGYRGAGRARDWLRGLNANSDREGGVLIFCGNPRLDVCVNNYYRTAVVYKTATTARTAAATATTNNSSSSHRWVHARAGALEFHRSYEKLRKRTKDSLHMLCSQINTRYKNRQHTKRTRYLKKSGITLAGNTLTVL